jgi:putative phosphoribosyl transferase
MIRRLDDRRHAGRLLAERLAKYKGDKECVVIALPRGGVVLGYEIARALDLALDVCIVRKLGVPFQPELAMGAIATGGVVVINGEVVSGLGIGQEEIDAEVAVERKELERREVVYRGRRPVESLVGKTVILVDDGIATGATAEAAIQAIRERGAPQIVVAVGVAPPDTVDRLRRMADSVVCLLQPDPLEAIGLWYRDFAQTTDEEVTKLLARAKVPEPAGAGAG